MIRKVNSSDANALTAIYNHYVLNSIITFEQDSIDEKEMLRRIGVHDFSLPWLVFEYDGAAIGYAYASPWKARVAYRFSAEVSVYLNPEFKNRGIGSMLYSQLITDLREKKYHALMGGISLPNDISIALHENFGFEKVAHFKQVGYKFDKWIDVAYWELIL